MNRIINLFSCLVLIIMTAGCSKQLDLVPTDTFSDANAFRTLNDAQLGTNEAYSRYGAYASTMYVNALLSDEAKIGVDNAGQGALTFRYQYSADATTGGDVTSMYGGFYLMIDQINRVLANLPKVQASAAEEPRRNVLKGQLLALRAIAHFDILEAYAKNYSTTDPKGVPYMLNYDANAQPARIPIAETVNLIEKDLADAKTLLPTISTSNPFRDTVMNQVNVSAYQARVALYKGDYQKAIDFATLVISANVKTLATGTAYNGIWTDANSNETLFRIRYSADASIGSIWTTTNGLIYIAPSDKLYASYVATDIRRSAFIGTNASGNRYVNKFYTSSRGGRIVDLKASRISEMYLIRSEAYAKLSSPNLTLGAADLNALRAARITGYVSQTFGNGPSLVAAVMDERFKELCFEGFRFYDLKRNGLPVQRGATDASASWQTLEANNYRFVLPIPQYELLANPNIVQNDSY